MVAPFKVLMATGQGHRRPHSIMVLAAVGTIVALTAGAGTAQAANPATTSPQITKAVLSRWVMPAVGGTTTLRLRVANAETCWFVGVPAVRVPAAHQNCSGGSTQVTVRVSPSNSLEITNLHIMAWAANSNGTSVDTTVYLVEEPLAPLKATTMVLKQAEVGKAYSDQLEATGGRAPYSWSLAGGELPIGLSLSPRGRLSGTPTIPGPSSISLEVADASRPVPLTTTVQLSLTTAPSPVVITTTALPSAATQSVYSATLVASGGVAPYAWTTVAGQLPPGFALGTSGVISGTPTAGGTFGFVVQASDSEQVPKTATARLSIMVTTPTLRLVTRSLPGATLNSPYSTTLVATGGIPPYSWDVNSGQLPSGITLSSNGVLSGTPTQAGTNEVAIKVADSSSTPQTVIREFNLVVAAVPLAITTHTLPGAVMGSGYNATLLATGGTAPYYWGVAAGQLPPGIALSTGGILTGTPTQLGSFRVNIKVSDSSPKPQTATVAYKLVVAPIPLLVATTALPAATKDNPYGASLTASGGTAPFTWRIVGGHLPPGVTFTSAGNLSGLPRTAGTYVITVKVTDTSPVVESATAQLALVVGNNQVNWSGYVSAGLYTSVTGTFIVPQVAAGQDSLRPAAASEWVGLDGVTSTGFIRAGVTEVAPGTGEPYCIAPAAGQFCVYPWLDVSSGPGEKPIVMTVNPGDSITVTIWEIKAGNWAITMDDNTSRVNFRAEENYTGAGSTAEYVVDAPSSVPCSLKPTQATATASCTTTPIEAIKALGFYSPAVQFTNLHTVGDASRTAAVLLVQNGVQVSTPSVMTPAGFTVAYGSVAPAAP